ncbi:hypothetical protein [Mycolicibacterium chubuense]|uniref:DUF559 domain-containing protein n=1 Tax=Mycolicibacterium chubuense TaxID=1800 RepID=A0A0J6WSB7_MYCCU|nr:hypothetical protein [Mycolicibacterium chubuense]KMO84652.1 hypothetical protein MCHUDSM44219_00413 [Mycolicibacterium chubuense]SPY00316.1 cullin, a subunit of E3 ubiquitin ligase [Mycolicibacterium chubuense]
MEDIIIGTEAVRDGVVTRYELQRWYRPIFGNVHAPKNRMITLRDRIFAAWLFSRREGIVTGLAASALHGSAWVDRDIDIELVFKFPRAPRGIIARDDRIQADEWTRIAGIPVATAERTAFDLGRFRRYDALSRLDALMQVKPYTVDDVMRLTERYKGARGVAKLKAVLPLVDGGAQSPMESWWREVVIDSGFPKPTTQIPVVDEFGRHVRYLDFGWREFQVAVEYDGDQHQTDRTQYLKDRWVIPELRRLRWTVISVVKEDDPVRVIGDLREALVARGWRGAVQIPRYAYASPRRRAHGDAPNLHSGRGSAS